MAKMKGDDFGIELPRKRLVGCLGLLEKKTDHDRCR